jgi:hypothetical protein
MGTKGLCGRVSQTSNAHMPNGQGQTKLEQHVSRILVSKKVHVRFSGPPNRPSRLLIS